LLINTLGIQNNFVYLSTCFGGAFGHPLFFIILKFLSMSDFELDGDFADFVDQLENSEKNENACSIDNPDCEGCGS